MKQNVTLTIASLLSVLFMTVHMTDDIVRGMEPGTLFDLVIVPIVVLQLYGTVVLAGKRSGYVIVLIVSLLELVVPAVHMKGAGVGAIAQSNGGFFFVWILFALCLTALFCVVLSARGLWEKPWRTASPHKDLEAWGAEAQKRATPAAAALNDENVNQLVHDAR